VTVLNNRGGVEIIGNTVSGAVNTSGNSGPGPYPGDTSVVSGNGPSPGHVSRTPTISPAGAPTPPTTIASPTPPTGGVGTAILPAIAKQKTNIGLPAPLAVSANVTPPLVSQSYYVLASQGASHTPVYNEGHNAPTGSQLVFLQFGGICNGDGVFVYQAFECIDDTTIAWQAEWWLYGYAQNPSHRNSGTVEVAVTVNNSVGSDTASGVNGEAQHLYASIISNTLAYATELNIWSSYNGLGETYAVAGGNDIEPNFNGPGVSTPWADGWVTAASHYNDYLLYMVDGAYYGTCASAACWNTPGQNGWTPHQIYYVNWGALPGYSVPQMYDNTWGNYWNDLNNAASSVGIAGGATYGRDQFTGVMWGCGIAGISEPNPKQAYTDFANETNEDPAYLTLIHAEGGSC